MENLLKDKFFMKRQRLTDKIAADQRKKDSEKGVRRNLDGFDYDKTKAKVLKRALHNINVSLGTLISAMKDLSMLRGSEVTPDGMLGGRGFIMPFKDIKNNLNEAVTNLSDVTDTLADELTNPKWGLSTKDVKKVKKEKEEIEEEVELVEEEVKDDVDQETPKEEKEEVTEDISPEDVKDSSEIDSLKRYKDLVEGNVKDRVAGILSKPIVANLLKGDN